MLVSISLNGRSRCAVTLASPSYGTSRCYLAAGCLGIGEWRTWPNDETNTCNLPCLVQRSEFTTLQQTRIFCEKNNSGSPTKKRFATHLLGTGAHMWTIRLLLGHRSLQTTMIYTHLLEAKRLVTSPLDYLRT